ncbi:MAG: enoyl-CoA hydratase family protein [Actinobacteria bacterium]|nr:enoyl-CoA hydratase family protein [Acidimicrobiia bacterium]MCA1736738.1 enoyl-CoA hydratase family protein [Actinomycetota bacterium]MDQ3500841.1 enoyl-CoA hydratase family protein [Actinomycetota bacterium]
MPYAGSARPTAEWNHFDFAISDGVGRLTFDRPDVLNALTFEVYADLRDLLGELEHDGRCRVLVITGRGKGFCSGGDVNEIIGALQEMATDELLEFTRMTGAVVQKMRELPIPIVAAVNGTAAGAGAVIALAADLRLLAASASFHFLFTRVGLAGADMGAAYLLPRVIGFGRASELLLLGERVGAEEAAAMGLGRVVPDAELAATAGALATTLASGPAWAVGATKSLLTREQDMSLGSAIELEAWAQALLMRSDDHREFYRAFVARESPRFTGR